MKQLNGKTTLIVNEMCNDVWKLPFCVPSLIKDATLLHAGSYTSTDARVLYIIVYPLKHLFCTSLVFQIDLFYFISLWMYIVFSEFNFFNMHFSFAKK